MAGGIGSYWSVTGAAMEPSGGTLLAFALSLAPDPQQQERKKVAYLIPLQG